ncbi:S41 family peptidase [Lysobacter sp. cf310]|uniref:S41 family peptidase n=1 Tax=Lysobacter sp. cf310 TaxID=1761790 RepID=UPI0008E03FD2|nr:S41 family peptidase [Lysobacter sp. cf310]SFK36639.1 C-terminal processing protease CtpA/Prc, contains a PDZ domain [Lysobacter sp. cf310]
MPLPAFKALPALALTLLLGVGCGHQAASAELAVQPTTPVPAETRIAAAEVRAEFEELYRRLRDSHYDLYARRNRAEYDALYARMHATFDRPLTAFEVQTRFQTFAAYGRIAHANIAFPLPAFQSYREGGGRAFPLSLRAVAGKLRVSENLSGQPAPAPGTEIVAIDGRPAATWLRGLSRHVSADNDYLAQAQMEMWLPALVWLEHGPRDSYALRIRDAQGHEADLSLPARTQAQMRAAAAAQPKSLELDWDRREYRMLDGGVAYLRPGPFYNNTPGAADMWDYAAFSSFIDEAFRSFLRADAKTLLIDLRSNPGGDNSFSDLMVAWYADRPFRFVSEFKVKASQAAIDSNRKRLDADASERNATSRQYARAYARHRLGEVFDFEIPMTQPRAGERFRGKVYLLIDRRSYSNTVTVAALSQDYGFATVLGEETSDLATSYGASESFTLSRTGIEVKFPKAYLIRPSGNTEARGVVPDIAIETPLVAGADDPVLARALRIVADGPELKRAAQTVKGE